MMWRQLLLALACLCATVAHAQDKSKPFVPTSVYVDRQVEGWTVRVNHALLEDQKELGVRALALMETKLKEVEAVLPAKVVDRLRKVPIWLGLNDGHAPGAEYHPSKDWLRDNGYNPDKAKGVEIGNAQSFVTWSEQQPSMVLHELAHAYHDQVLDFDHPEILAAYRRVKESGKYDKVKHVNGREERHYALTDQKEFFAEMTESFFGKNDFFPFDRAELVEYDPETARIVREAWLGKE